MKEFKTIRVLFQILLSLTMLCPNLSVRAEEDERHRTIITVAVSEHEGMIEIDGEAYYRVTVLNANQDYLIISKNGTDLLSEEQKRNSEEMAVPSEDGEEETAPSETFEDTGEPERTYLVQNTDERSESGGDRSGNSPDETGPAVLDPQNAGEELPAAGMEKETDLSSSEEEEEALQEKERKEEPPSPELAAEEASAHLDSNLQAQPAEEECSDAQGLPGESIAEEEESSGNESSEALNAWMLCTTKTKAWKLSGSARSTGTGPSKTGTFRSDDFSLAANETGLYLQDVLLQGNGQPVMPGPDAPHGPVRIRGSWRYEEGILSYELNGAVYYMTCENGQFGCSQTAGTEMELYTSGPGLNPCVTSQPQAFSYNTPDSRREIPVPSVGVDEIVSDPLKEWSINGSGSYASGEDVRDALAAIAEPGVYTVVCTVSGRAGDTYYRETTQPANYIYASGVIPNSFLTFTDVHMEFSLIGEAIAEIMGRNDGRIPSLILCTGDWWRMSIASEEETDRQIMPALKAVIGGVDTVYVAGNHESGKSASRASRDANLGADDSFINNGYGVVFDSDSDGVLFNGRSSKETNGLLVYGINYDSLGSGGNYAYSEAIRANAQEVLSSAAEQDPSKFVVFSTHAGLHVLNNWGGNAKYNINSSNLMRDLINASAESRNQDILFLFGHDHSQGEKEFLYTRGDMLTSTINSEARESDTKPLCFSYGHGGYLSNAAGAADRHYSFVTWDDEMIVYSFGKLGDEASVIVIPRLSKEPQYELVRGGGETYVKGSGTELAFEIVQNGYDHAFENFVSAEVNGMPLTEEDFEKKEGSLILTLSSDYLETLAAGKYTLKVNFRNDHEVFAGFAVKKKQKPAPEPASSPAPAETSMLFSPAKGASAMPVPNTGDPFDFRRLAVTEFVSLFTALLSLAMLRRRK